MGTIAVQASAALGIAICFIATFLCACACGLSGRISREQGDGE